MKRFDLLLFFICLLCPSVLPAQSILDASSVSGLRSDTVAKTILDQAKYRVYYAYSAKPDPSLATEDEGITLLQVGTRYNAFKDYYAIKSDSINDTSVKSGIPFSQFMGDMMATHQKIKFNPTIIMNHAEGKISTQEILVIHTQYIYDEPLPDLEWKYEEGDTVIAGYACKKAMVHFSGRDYVAWYSEEVDMPYGPYKFGGLPGLIFCIYDTRRHYVFTLMGLEKVDSYDPIYLVNGSKMAKITREKSLKIRKNYCQNPGKAMIADGIPKINEEVLSEIPPKPFNPIELE